MVSALHLRYHSTNQRSVALLRPPPGGCVRLQGQGMYGLGNTRLFSCLSFQLSKWADLAHMCEGLLMVAPRKTKKVFCTVVRVAVTDNRNIGPANRFSTRPSDLLPWADPYIARLVRRLQDEVRSERCSAGALRADLEPCPYPGVEGRLQEVNLRKSC